MRPVSAFDTSNACPQFGQVIIPGSIFHTLSQRKGPGRKGGRTFDPGPLAHPAKTGEVLLLASGLTLDLKLKTTPLCKKKLRMILCAGARFPPPAFCKNTTIRVTQQDFCKTETDIIMYIKLNYEWL